MSLKHKFSWADVSDVESSRQSVQKHLTNSTPQPKSPPENKPKGNQLFDSINELDTNNVYLCLLGVAFEASYDDIADYFEDIDSPIIRFIPQKNKRVYVIQLKKRHALNVAKIPKHTFMNRDFIIKLDREKYESEYVGKQVNKSGRNGRNKGRVQFKEREKVVVESELMKEFKKATISAENMEIIRSIKGKVQ